MAGFFTFEGPDGSGKTTQMELLRRALEEEGHEVVALREPGGTVLGDAIRRLVLDTPHLDLHHRTETLLFNAARAQIVARVIRPALRAGKTVLCDRYADSTLAYQGFGHGQALEALEPLIQYATGGLEPTLRILLDLPPDRALARKEVRNRLDAHNLDFHRAVHRGYQVLMQRDPESWLRVDASRPAPEIHAEIRQAIGRILSRSEGVCG